MRMRNMAGIGLAPAVLAFALAGTAAAQPQNWRASSASDEAQGYIDTDSIDREGDRVRFWREIRFGQVQSTDSGERFDRIAAHYEGDCRLKTLRSMTLRVRLGGRLVFEGEDTGETEAVSPGSAGDADLRAACFNEWPG